jgi:hypothetical protein
MTLGLESLACDAESYQRGPWRRPPGCGGENAATRAEIMSKSGMDRVSEFWRLSVSKVGKWQRYCSKPPGKVQGECFGENKKFPLPNFSAVQREPFETWDGLAK